MSRVNGVGGGAPVGGSRAKAAAPSGGFDVAAEPATGPVQANQAVQPVALSAMLILQEAEGESAGNRNGRRHGLAVLAALQELQRGLLRDSSQEAQIAGLARLAEIAPAVTDPGLADVLAAIRLRARIELLRLGVETG
jgi:hypothetical protein